MAEHKEVFISVDVETAGPIPGEYSMLSIGASHVDSPDYSFECMLKPLNRNFVPDALKVTGLSLDDLDATGRSPEQAMHEFASWIKETCSDGGTPVFVGLNAPFDWSFINYYFHRFVGQNPFGFTALDIKAYFMGVTGCSWDDTRSSAITKVVSPSLKGDHNALHDAAYQAELFRLIRELQITKACRQRN
ncbi:DNA polymerase III, epsilon subunit [Paraburkholderia phenazinium]|jgi:DNA polymerase III epsilon subunit-like protein|uniref:DNA polymerase III, epsilon subunit n=1 Tax=Paraburkholderia phenazinium TaxID=60549 RepID=A0A1G8LXH3_9BURK|nr:3'-5' exonuclease [Paraburkholderia phenazinium]SDI13075.1 DNA polymerase III, epsilon subunit [Paraburkholderia phenazinium]SDI60389.1 DNA polymerase III, epsilon subunit [Paraburkholderia phenazinium]